MKIIKNTIIAMLLLTTFSYASDGDVNPQQTPGFSGGMFPHLKLPFNLPVKPGQNNSTAPVVEEKRLPIVPRKHEPLPHKHPGFPGGMFPHLKLPFNLPVKPGQNNPTAAVVEERKEPSKNSEALPGAVPIDSPSQVNNPSKNLQLETTGENLNNFDNASLVVGKYARALWIKNKVQPSFKDVWDIIPEAERNFDETTGLVAYEEMF